MAHGILIPASDRIDLTRYEARELADYQLAVDGWIEAVDVAPFGCTLFVNEDGHPRGLPFNRRATFLWWFHVARASPAEGSDGLPVPLRRRRGGEGKRV
ncbi:DUF3846 domain-containing protein [Microbacterium sp. cx-55]|uniref:DUF3846 domain-containing protein n=1 Tax=Microbacterium sp. cx-55 TaxID=2875948 RepID=UPI001CBC42EF|nr:DUF3846 domain-containing protein [Microbacterium sp. cx-55]